MAEFHETINRVQGFRALGVHGGLKKKGEQLDVALIISSEACAAAGVFTKNAVKAAPVLIDQERLATNAGNIYAVVMNSGCANACTGIQGMADARTATAYVAAKIDCAESDVLALSTGVIGQTLNMPALTGGIDKILASDSDDWASAAHAIMTTDTQPKMASTMVKSSSGREYTIAGIAKGAGMIAPNMATMLAVIVTDARISPEQARESISAANKLSFNRIVVDGDMSTNDTALLLANGASGVTLRDPVDLMEFNLALTQLCIRLAKAIVRDGEGATKFITLMVTGAPDDASAHQIANRIAISPLVKTAFYGQDANWGRILAAAGSTDVAIDPDEISVYIQPGEHPDTSGFALMKQGTPHNDEAAASAIMQAPSISVTVDCGMGHGEAIIWTCDLSHDYVSINGDYRT